MSAAPDRFERLLAWIAAVALALAVLGMIAGAM